MSLHQPWPWVTMGGLASLKPYHSLSQAQSPQVLHILAEKSAIRGNVADAHMPEASTTGILHGLVGFIAFATTHYNILS